MVFLICCHGMKMKDYKIKQILYNSLNVHDDLVSEFKVIDDKDKIIEYGIKYFQQEMPELIYPSKSYSVAIIYAYLLQKHFNAGFFESLNDRDLFCSNDRFFVPYASDPETYEAIMNEIGINHKNFTLNTSLEQIATTVHYFKQEFDL